MLIFLQEQNTPSADKLPIAELKVDLDKDYYKDLGVASHVSRSAIRQGFSSKCRNSTSTPGKHRLTNTI